jgi:hypothetical protein
MVRILVAAVVLGLAAGFAWSIVPRSVHPHVPRAVNPKPAFLPQSAEDKDWSVRAENEDTPSFEASAPDPTHDQSAIEQSVYYARCADARAAGRAPILRGQPGYRRGLDADSDGIACEPYFKS